MNLNRVTIAGNLTRDPQVKYTPSGTAVAEIGLAINRHWFDKTTNAKKEETTFVDVTLWGRTAELAGEYLAKGRPVLIEGRLQLETWDDKQTGQKRSKLKVVAENLHFVGTRQQQTEGQGSGQGQYGSGPPARSQDPGDPPAEYAQSGPATSGRDDEVPF